MILRTEIIYSRELNSRKTCYVGLPDGYGAETDWISKGNAIETTDSLFSQSKLRESIIVMPSDGGYDIGTFYADWYDGSGKL